MFEWTPLVGFGPLKFQAPVEPYVQQGTLVSVEFSNDLKDSTGWDAFSYIDEDTIVYVDSGRIVSISCDRHCVLSGRNLIGMDYLTVKELIGSEPEGDPDIENVIDEVLEVYDFDQVAALVWVSDGVVVSIDCNDGID